MEMMPGRPLTKEIYRGLTVGLKKSVWEQMVIFLRELHDCPVDMDKDLGVKKYDGVDEWKEVLVQLEEVVFPVVGEDIKRAVSRRFEDFFELTANCEILYTVIHGDFAPEHIWLGDRGEIGVIDFADMHIYDPAYDLRVEYCYGQEFLDYFYGKYDADDNFEVRRSFYEFVRRPRNLRHSILTGSDEVGVQMRQLEEECQKYG